MKSKYKATATAAALALIGSLTLAITSASPANAGTWCSGVNISYFKGGTADSFSDILEKGARQAGEDTGANVTIISSNWDFPTMVQKFKEEIAKKPDAISFMGHPGDAAIVPSAQAAKAAGILVDFSNVPAPKSIKTLNAGFTGANLKKMGNNLAARSITDFKLKKGDEAIVIGTFGVPGRSDREDGTVNTLERAGVKVTKLDLKVFPGNAAGDPNLVTPVLTANILKSKQLKLIVAAGPILGNMNNYFSAAKLEPGQVKVSGFDLGESVLKGFADGYIQLSADQEPFKQGYMPVVSLCLAKKFGLGQVSVDTSSGFVTADNYKTVTALPKGYR
jgi:simple sugar transport system substrate-binding protein